MSQRALDIIYHAIDELNAQSDGQVAIAKSPGTNLLEGDNGIDSLAMVNLVVAVEQEIESRTGQSVTIIDETVLAAGTHPFRSISTMADHIEALLAKAAAA